MSLLMRTSLTQVTHKRSEAKMNDKMGRNLARLALLPMVGAGVCVGDNSRGCGGGLITQGAYLLVAHPSSRVASLAIVIFSRSSGGARIPMRTHTRMRHLHVRFESEPIKRLSLARPFARPS